METLLSFGALAALAGWLGYRFALRRHRHEIGEPARAEVAGAPPLVVCRRCGARN